MRQMGFVAACREYFGYKPGQNSGEFLAEMKALTKKDREDLTNWFPSVGITITASV